MSAGVFLIGLLAVVGVLAAGYTIKTVITHRSSRKSSIRVTSQKANVAGGDIVGGDKNTR